MSSLKLKTSKRRSQPSSVPFIDLSEQHRKIGKELKRAVSEVIDSAQFILKDFVLSLEQKIAKKVGARHAVGVASGSDALYLSLWAADVSAGDEVITSAFTYYATAGAIARLGAKPVFVDIDPLSFTIEPRAIETKISPRTKAVIPVHLYGLCADMRPILNIAKNHSLVVIEDCAQAFGATYDGKGAGSMGDAGCFSFYPTKNLGAAGDGGMVVTSSDRLAGKLRLLRNNGAKVMKYQHEIVSTNSRLDEIQAAVLSTKLKYIDQWNNQRRAHAADYNAAFRSLPLKTPLVPKDREHVYHLYTLLTESRNDLLDFLTKKGVGAAVYYPIPLHLQPCFRNLGYKKGDLPYTEKITEQILSLPMYPELTQTQKARVISSVREFFGWNKS